MLYHIKLKLLVIILAFTSLNSYAQDNNVLDQVAAVVGDKAILQSEIEQRFLQYKMSGEIFYSGRALKCQILEDLLIENLLLDQAEIDSITVTNDEVSFQLEQRLNYFIERIGSEEKLEQYFNKSLYNIRQDLGEALSDQIITQKMRQEITKNAGATPSEIKKFYNQMPADSIPYIDAKIELAQIVLYPPYNEEAISAVKKRLIELRKRIVEGEKFSTLAVLYSKGENASKGGEMGFKGKAELPPKYADVAFKLKEGSISGIVETNQGYHIIKLIERKGNKVNTQQILLKPQYPPEVIQDMKNRLDSIATLIRTKESFSFADAAKAFSQDKNTRVNGGLLINPMEGTSKFNIDDLPINAYYAVKDLKEGQISDPFQSTDENGNFVYKIMQLKNRIPPHKANLEQDYDVILNLIMTKNKNQAFIKWLKEKRIKTYIHIDDDYTNCEFELQNWVN
jgi:peptidyl-prolyl cis-trans isomerase SurA